MVDLSRADNRGYDPGRSVPVRITWMVVEALTLLNPLFLPYSWKAAILRLFGAKVGTGLVIKPSVHIKYPWRLDIGDHVWLGERLWIDNFVMVSIGDNACVSQAAYLCTGNHDWTDPHMGLVVRPIRIESGAWVGAHAVVGPGVTVGMNAIITVGSVQLNDANANGVYRGHPATRIKERRIQGGGPPRRRALPSRGRT